MSNKKLTLSIVIPAYNEQGYLKACLDSIANQRVAPEEVIVVDNNSDDNTAMIASGYSFVRVVSEKKQGVFFASYRGFYTARRAIIARIDADTILSPDWVASVKRSFTAPISAVTGPVYYYDMPLGSKNYWFDHLMRKITYKWARKTPFLYGTNMAILKKDWRQISHQLCSERDIHEDIDMAIHLNLAGKKILYSKKLLCGASGRRYNDNLKSFSEYISMYKRTFARHRMHSWAIYPAVFMWFLGYVLIHPWRKLWRLLIAPINQTYSLTGEVRKNPMSS